MKYNLEGEFHSLSDDQKRIKLYLNQKHLLELFFERNAISKAQYEKSLNDLTTKMHMEEYR